MALVVKANFSHTASWLGCAISRQTASEMQFSHHLCFMCKSRSVADLSDEVNDANDKAVLLCVKTHKQAVVHDSKAC